MSTEHIEAATAEPTDTAEASPTKTQRRAKGGKTGQPATRGKKAPTRPKQGTTKGKKAAPAKRSGTKQEQLIAMLKRAEGVTVEEVVQALGWQPHTVRGAIAGALKKKLGMKVDSEKVDGRGRVYRIID